MPKLHFVALALTACTSTSTSSTGSELTGSTAFRDAHTDHTGATQAPARPDVHDASVTVVVTGAGEIPQVDPRCVGDLAGAFEASYATIIDPSGAYLAALGDGSLATPSGCAIATLSGGVVTGIAVHAELAATLPSCQAYCAASARADAETQCGAADASCRAGAESSLAASCTTTCTSSAHAIAADASLGASAIGSVDADALRAAAFGDLAADLTFDHLIDADGHRL
jgi:hypothetical protein